MQTARGEPLPNLAVLEESGCSKSAYCTHGSPAADQKMVLCKNRGVVSPYFACRKFRYDPLLRVPHRQELPHYDPKDFSLED